MFSLNISDSESIIYSPDSTTMTCIVMYHILFKNTFLIIHKVTSFTSMMKQSLSKSLDNEPDSGYISYK